MGRRGFRDGEALKEFDDVVVAVVVTVSCCGSSKEQDTSGSAADEKPQFLTCIKRRLPPIVLVVDVLVTVNVEANFL